MTHDRRQLESILPLLEGLPVVGDVLGPLIKKLLGMLGLSQNGPVSSEAISSLVTPTSAQISEIAQLLSAASSHL